jgi:hypothetical protein
MAQLDWIEQKEQISNCGIWNNKNGKTKACIKYTEGWLNDY